MILVFLIPIVEMRYKLNWVIFITALIGALICVDATLIYIYSVVNRSRTCLGMEKLDENTTAVKIVQ